MKGWHNIGGEGRCHHSSVSLVGIVLERHCHVSSLGWASAGSISLCIISRGLGLYVDGRPAN